MNEKVIALKGGSVDSARRNAFLQSVALSFDRYVTEHQREPEAIVYVYCGIRQPSQIAWDIRGESEGGVTSVLSLAAVHTLTEAGSSRQGL